MSEPAAAPLSDPIAPQDSEAAPAAKPLVGPRSALRHAPGWQIWGAMLIVYVVWGSTYLGIRIVVETMPPLLTLGIRFGIAAAIMGVILVIRQGPGVLRITRPELLGSLLIGALLLGIGNGGVMLGERDVPSGLTALILGIIPLVVLIIRRIMGERIDRIQVIGVDGGTGGSRGPGGATGRERHGGTGGHHPAAGIDHRLGVRQRPVAPGAPAA